VTDAVAGYVRAASTLDEGGAASKINTPRPDERSPFTPTYHFAIEKYDGTTEPFIRMEPLATLVAHLFGAKVDDSQCVDYPPNENKVQALKCESTRASLKWTVRRPFVDALRDVGKWYEPINESQRKALLASDLRAAVEAMS
jgi:nucleoside-diphosphate-sugar epimerase